MSLLDRRILLVTGKGGVGKSTVSAALGLAAAATGKKTLIAEVAGNTRMAEVFGLRSLGYEPTALARNLYGLSITPEAAIEDYVVQTIKVRTLFKLAFQNRVMGPFMDAVPGLHDAVQLGKIFDLERDRSALGRRSWDLIIVDAPATGHGLTMLSAPRSMMELTRGGPIYEGVRQVHDIIDNPQLTAILLVALAEDMPVNETLELWGRLGPSQASVALCVCNEMGATPIPDEALWQATTALRGGDRALDEAIELTRRARDRALRQQQNRQRLASALPVPTAELPLRTSRQLNLDELLSMGQTLLKAGGAA